MINILNTLKYFFEDTIREISIREFARIKKIAPATASKLLKKLNKEGLLEKIEDKGYILFKANTQNKTYKGLSLIYWEEKFKELIEELNRFYAHPSIILFGSLAKCENTKNSDIDIAVISENTKNFPKLSKFEKSLKREIQIFNIKTIKDFKNKNLLNNILNGHKIEGYIEWI